MVDEGQAGNPNIIKESGVHWLDAVISHGNIEGAFLLNKDGKVVNSSMSKASTHLCAEFAQQAADKARAIIRELESDQDLKILRVVLKQREIVIASQLNEFLLVIVQRHIFKPLRADV